MLNNSQKQFFPALTGLRAIAAWMVFIYHFAPYNNPNFPTVLKKIFANFNFGVDIFFVLSGFLITYRYFDQPFFNFKKYMVNRFARIYPMYFIVSIGTFVTIYFSGEHWNKERTIELVLNFTMTKALFEKYIYTGVMQGWTLTLEELFYLTAPFYFFLIRKRWHWLIVLPIFIFCFGSLLKCSFAHVDSFGEFMQNNISTYIVEFFTGIFVGLLILKKTAISFKGYHTYCGLLFIGCYLIIYPYIKELYQENDLTAFIRMLIISSFGISTLIIGLIIEKNVIQKILSHKLMILLGKSSYIFYLIHAGWLANLIFNYATQNIILIFIILNLISILLFKSIEEPMNRWIRRL